MKFKFSPRFTLTKEDRGKIFKGALIALLGALATYLQDTIPTIDFGTWTVLAGAVNSILVNAILKFVSEHTYSEN